MPNKNDDNFLFFILGSIIGLIVGIMYAPERGYRTRRKVKNFIDDIRNCSTEKLEKVKIKFNDLCDDGKEIFLKDEDNNPERID